MPWWCMFPYQPHSYLAANVSESCKMFGQVQNRPISLANRNYQSRNVLVTHGISVCFSKMIFTEFGGFSDKRIRIDEDSILRPFLWQANILTTKQVCIPVGCVPPACCPYLPACTAPGGVCSGWVSAPGGIPACNGADTPLPVDRILDTRFWKYYLAPTSLLAVTTKTRVTDRITSGNFTQLGRTIT